MVEQEGTLVASCEDLTSDAQGELWTRSTPPWTTRGGEVGLIHSDNSPKHIYLHSLRDG